jgi:hypothetical protein
METVCLLINRKMRNEMVRPCNAMQLTKERERSAQLQHAETQKDLDSGSSCEKLRKGTSVEKKKWMCACQGMQK